MDVVPDVVKKEIESLDRGILVLQRMKALPDIEKVEFIRRLRTKNDSILDFLLTIAKMEQVAGNPANWNLRTVLNYIFKSVVTRIPGVFDFARSICKRRRNVIWRSWMN
ncbi:hypothetical protein TcWFU_004626 [Taenia crassiceps]|uniref:Uncharacterized protein n=1 Tax=Taenia crassiceps TaxID=6207 RepID=A0ABR4QH11_9CEST